MSAPVGVGDLVAWDGGVLLIGHANRVIPTHAHQAIQVAFGYAGPVGLRRSDDEPWLPYPLGIVASRQSHSMDATAATYNAVIFVEPETSAGRTLAARLPAGGLASIDEAAVRGVCTDLFAGWLAGSSKPQLITGATRVIAALTSSAAAPTVTDDRILRAIEFVRTHLDTDVTLDAVAAHVFLSPGRFRHLFVEQTGMGMRPYILWRRFILAWDLLAQGESISTAAHRAGFADAAHFTRTSNRMFGFPPSLLQVAAGPTPPTP
ncbi:MAG: helix-turn-helix transcriptional regulator [Gemmatimonadaceae bacterium]|nr:helix-turn-helix transcriptional regulator [Gemmatimonadaceae bacterium]MCW5826854.1 helix-turn-helix transcriptional regulator [Gemmatimonadaceae bacterium]